MSKSLESVVKERKKCFEALKNEHLEHFGIEVVLIGYFGMFDDASEAIEKAIENNIPYDEYKELSEEERADYDAGELCL